MKVNLQVRQKRGILPKAVSGAIVALALVILPLPALAEGPATAANSTTSQSQSQSQSQPADSTATTSTAPAADQGTAPSASSTSPTVTQTTAEPAGTLQATPNNQSNSISLQSDPSASTATQNTASNTPAGTTNTADTRTTANDPKAAVKTGTTVTSDATSGNATLKDNRDVGDAATGNATAGATVINVANANGTTAKDFQTFNCDIRQDVQGNIVIDPTTLLPYCSNSPATGTVATNNAGDGQSLQSGSSLVDILNKIVLNAASGNATIDSNRDTGNATTGDAAAIANIMNIANTAISAQRSFLGVINIYGNLQGNILVPQSLVDGLAKTGSVPVSGNVATDVTNNINANAISGNALNSGNRTNGDATSSDAATGVTIMNLTGQEVVAKNSLLVFVNVMGKWMGMIVPAPGSKTALLGSGVQASGANSTPPIYRADTKTNITNDITVNAQSGNAAVTNNRDAGNATTGRAQAGVNLLNITNSNFVLDDWFGALFINVLGSWLGNFDIESAVAANGGNMPPVSDVQVYQVAEPMTVAPAPSSAARMNTTTGSGSTGTAGIPVTTATTTPQTIDTSTGVTPAGHVLGTSTTKQPMPGPQGIKLDILSLGAVVTALTLLTALGTAAIRHRFSA